MEQDGSTGAGHLDFGHFNLGDTWTRVATEKEADVSKLIDFLPALHEGDTQGHTRCADWQNQDKLPDPVVAAIKEVLGLAPDESIRPSYQDFPHGQVKLVSSRPADPHTRTRVKTTFTIATADEGGFEWCEDTIDFADPRFLVFVQGEYIGVATHERIKHSTRCECCAAHFDRVVGDTE
tara:strand:+ start:188 stop:724 length:537 start_codon:yes stop_codon:yes gene_type:complete